MTVSEDEIKKDIKRLYEISIPTCNLYQGHHPPMWDPMPPITICKICNHCNDATESDCKCVTYYCRDCGEYRGDDSSRKWICKGSPIFNHLTEEIIGYRNEELLTEINDLYKKYSIESPYAKYT